MISFEVLLYAYPAKTVMWYTHYTYNVYVNYLYTAIRNAI